MVAVARALGFRVLVFDDLGGPLGILVARTISILRDLTQAEAAVTIAHELSHAINDEGRLIPPRPEWVLEFQMDAAAAAVLAPREDMVNAFLRGAGPEDIIAMYPNVTFSLLVQRMLRILPPPR